MITKPTIYTRERVLNELTSFLEKIHADPDILFKKELLQDKDYSSQRYSERAEKYKDDTEISEIVDKIDDILEIRIAKWGLKNLYNPAITKLTLTNHYKWKDKTEVEQTNKWSVSVTHLYDEDNK